MATDDQLLRLRYKPADLMRWEAALRRLGPEMVRLRFDERARPGARDDQVVPGLVPEAPHPPAAFVERWLRGQSMTVTNARAMLPAIGVAVVLATLSYLAYWELSGVLHHPITPHDTPPTINAVLSAPPSVSQVNPSPGTSTAGTAAAPAVQQGRTSN